jgi:hypothetical protein
MCVAYLARIYVLCEILVMMVNLCFMRDSCDDGKFV